MIIAHGAYLCNSMGHFSENKFCFKASVSGPSPRAKSSEKHPAFSASQFSASYHRSGKEIPAGNTGCIAKGIDAARALIRRRKPVRVRFPAAIT